jgi:hypothetical protein
VFACLVFVPIGCARHLETKDVYSPGGRLFLRIEIDESGGAAVSDVTSVFLFLSNSGASSGELIFKGSAMSNFSADWRGPDLVQLAYTDGYVSICDAAPAPIAQKGIRVIGCK